ncbi:ribonuclease Y [soil metagenome]
MNEDVVIMIVALVAGLAAGAVAMLLYRNAMDEKAKKSAADEAERILQKARGEAQRIDRESKSRAKDFEARAKKQAETEIQKQKEKMTKEEKALADREVRMDREAQTKDQELQTRLQEIAGRDEKVKIAEKKLIDLETAASQQAEALKARLEQVSKLTQAEAKKEMIEALTEDAKIEASRKAQEIEERAVGEAEEKARRTIAVAIARYASEFTSERTVTVISLPSEDMKGKIIGREGRNIRALEAACGVDLIVDETPEAVVISSFDPVRREVARKALEKLMEDGRVHPARIEEVIDKVKKDLFKSIKDDGEKAAFDLGLHGLHPEITKVLGGLKYRHAVSQNILDHSIEVAHLAGMMAGELGEDVKRARRAGLLHDIGKGIEHTVEGSHAVVGADFIKKFGEHESVVHAVRAHHDEEKPSTVLAFIVQAANIISNSRPGAKRASIDAFVRRMEDLESIGNSFDGVIRTFAVQAGKEVRVLVEASRVTDDQAQMLSYDIARKIEREMSHPGQVQVTVIREVRVVEHAR